MNSKKNTIIAIAIFILSLIFIILPIISRHNLENKTKNYSKTIGTFAGSEYAYNSEGNDMYNIVYKYMVNHKDYYYHFEYTTSSPNSDYEDITILYNPKNPSEAYSLDFRIGNVLQIVGIVLFFISIMIKFQDNEYVKDICLFLLSCTTIVILFINKLYSGGATIFMCVFILLTALSIFDFRKNLRQDDLTIGKIFNKNRR